MSCDTKHHANIYLFDIETTGLGPHCKIIEICLHAVDRWSLEKCEANSQTPPRVVDKLALCVDPEMEISDKAEEMTGLSRELLQCNQRGAFREGVAKLIKSFLEIHFDE
ncbi:three-prime repair exonuclease 1-like [Acanthaster planci]|uniref:Three-prime repair exonuclease 1-like n=1 Tax=Acanthaster planci TaxID=133434 RepID=A0A8B7ZCX0_ACAPL|nr:three-prime repair exonuclease 1-like [Acanthaster planci]